MRGWNAGRGLKFAKKSRNENNGNGTQFLAVHVLHKMPLVVLQLGTWYFFLQVPIDHLPQNDARLAETEGSMQVEPLSRKESQRYVHGANSEINLLQL